MWRKVEIGAEQTLEDLHYAIQHAYNWGADHLYSFFMSGRAWDGDSEYRPLRRSSPWDFETETSEEDVEASEVLDMFGEEGDMLESLGITTDDVEEILTNLAASEESRDVRTTTIESLNLKVDKEFLYLFDYGDEWHFKVRVHAIHEDADPDVGYPRIVESVGDAPSQYGPWDDGV
ncbi:MAG: IS1096 element passenger TnpR family protein [Anaerolineales bacterium]